MNPNNLFNQKDNKDVAHYHGILKLIFSSAILLFLFFGIALASYFFLNSIYVFVAVSMIGLIITILLFYKRLYNNG